MPARKPAARKGKVQLIDASSFWQKMRKSLGSKRKELSPAHIEDITRRAPFRQMDTPGGFRMSVAMSNCGPLGWVSDRQGYRYAAWDPATGEGWPEMPEGLRALARHLQQHPRFAAELSDENIDLMYKSAPLHDIGKVGDRKSTRLNSSH